MSTLQSITNLVNAATGQTVISPATLGMPAGPGFIGSDAVTAPAGGFSAIYAFGDSLSDAGNIHASTAGVLPMAPYSDGRFTNGNVWVQDLSQNLGLPAVKPSLEGGTDYAYGGAETGGTGAHAANPSDLPSQIAQFEANVPTAPASALYTVWIGSNDVLDIANSGETAAQQQANVAQAVNNEVAGIDALIAHGARNLVVLDVPDLGKTPYEAARPATEASATSLAETYNADLGAAIQQIVAQGGASVDFVDTFGMLDKAAASPATYGLTNVTQPVWTGTFTDSHSGTFNAAGAAQGGYLYWDDLHPTATGHSLIAQAVTQTLTGTA